MSTEFYDNLIAKIRARDKDGHLPYPDIVHDDIERDAVVIARIDEIADKHGLCQYFAGGHAFVSTICNVEAICEDIGTDTSREFFSVIDTAKNKAEEFAGLVEANGSEDFIVNSRYEPIITNFLNQFSLRLQHRAELSKMAEQVRARTCALESNLGEIAVSAARCLEEIATLRLALHNVHAVLKGNDAPIESRVTVATTWIEEALAPNEDKGESDDRTP